MNEIILPTFPVDSLEGVRDFELHLDQYVDAVTNGHSVAQFSLASAFDGLPTDQLGGRMFAALLDIRVGLAMLCCNTMTLGRRQNMVLPSTGQERPTFSRPEAFQLRMDMHENANAFVFRFRSLWDKFMGLLVLRFVPAEYERFAGAKSKKAAFRKIFNTAAGVPAEFVSAAETLVQGFDDLLRTPEAHGTGSLRKKSFTWTRADDSPAMAVLGYWNFLNEIAHVTGAMFDPAARKRLQNAHASQSAA